jgi:hypothetical protein
MMDATAGRGYISWSVRTQTIFADLSPRMQIMAGLSQEQADRLVVEV